MSLHVVRDDKDTSDLEKSPLAKFKDEAIRYQKTITAASRFIRRQLTHTGHGMLSKSFWMQTVPNQDVDVVITFHPETSETSVLWVKEKIEKIPGIILKTKSMTLTQGTHTRRNCFGFLISASYKGYLQGLEQMQIPKLVKSEFGGGRKEFTIKESAHFRGIENLNDFLTSMERQSIILHLLNTLRAENGDSLAGDLNFLEGEAILPRCLSSEVIYQLFPVHEPNLLHRLQQSWVRNVLEPQPIDSICEYFGVKIALYFAWLGHYTTALCIPAVVGSFFWLFFCGRSEFLDDIGFVLFGFFNVIWATLYLESWKRRSSELAYEWGTADQRPELLAEPRPLFKGEERISEVTGKPERFYPEWKRNVFRYLVTIPVISVCLLVVFICSFLILELQQWWDEVIDRKSYFAFLRYLPKILLAFVIPTLDKVYSKIAIWLNNMENYRMEDQYEDHLVIKLMLFQFVNSFLALFYTAFYLQDIEKLKELLAALLITRQVMGNVKEALFPYITQQLRFAKISFDLYGAMSPSRESPSHKSDTDETSNHPERESSERSLSQVEMESSRPAYEGTYDDYLEIFIQFGYVILFSSAYPLAGIFALLNNLIEIRGDAFKLCHIHQRPFGQRVNNIGSWQDAMELMGTVGVLVNCALIGLSGQVNRMFPNITPTQTILLIVVLEHLVLILKMMISYVIPDIPSWVATEMAKIEFHRREIEKASSFALLQSSGFTSVAPSSVNSLETVDRSVQTEDFETIVDDEEIEPLHDETLSSTQIAEEDTRKSENSRKPFEKMNSLSSLSSVDVDRFKATVVNQSSKRVFDKPHRSNSTKTSRIDLQLSEDEQLRKRSLPDRPNNEGRHIPSSSTTKMELDGHTKMLYQRMASDTDLWLGLKARQAKYKNLLGAKKELSPVEDERSFSSHDPSENQISKPVNPAKRQEEAERKLKAKRAVFVAKGRSLSLASFRLLPSSGKRHHHKLNLDRSTSKPSTSNGSSGLRESDEQYLRENRAQGELEILNVESLINVNDVRKLSN